MTPELTLEEVFNYQKNNESLFTELGNTVKHINEQFKSISKEEYSGKKIPIIEDSIFIFTNEDKSKSCTSFGYIILDLLNHFSSANALNTKFKAKDREMVFYDSFKDDLTTSFRETPKTVLFSSILFYIKFNSELFTYVNLNDSKNFFELKHINLFFKTHNYTRGEDALNKYSIELLKGNLTDDTSFHFTTRWGGISSFPKIKTFLKKGCDINLKSSPHSWELVSDEYLFFKLCSSNNDFLSNFSKKTQDDIHKIINDNLPKTNCSYDLSNKMAIKIFETTLPEKITQKFFKDTLKLVVEKNKNKIENYKSVESIYLSSLMNKYGFKTISSLKYLENHTNEFISEYFSYDNIILNRIKSLNSMDIDFIYSLIKKHLKFSIGNSQRLICILTSIQKLDEDIRAKVFKMLLDDDFFSSQNWKNSNIDFDNINLALSTNNINLFYKTIYLNLSERTFDVDWTNFRGIPDEALTVIKKNYFNSYAKKTFFFSYSRGKLDDFQFASLGYTSYDSKKDMEEIYNIFLETEKLANC